MKSAKGIIGVSGEYYVAAYLSGLDLVVSWPGGGNPETDLFVAGHVGAGLRIQLKTGRTRCLLSSPLRKFLDAFEQSGDNVWSTLFRVLGEKSMALTPRDQFRLPILQALARFGGRKQPRYLYTVIEEIMGSILTKEDHALRKNKRSEEPKWHTAVRFERDTMVKLHKPLLKRPDPSCPGYWQWTEFGRKYYEANRCRETAAT